MVALVAVVLITAGCSTGPSVETIKGEYEEEAQRLEAEVAELSGDLQTSQEMLGEKEALIADLSGQLKLEEEDKAAIIADYEGLQSDYEGLQLDYETLMSSGNGIPNVVVLSQVVIELIRDQDFATLSTYVHPSNGLRFTPYPFINLGTDLIMSTAQVSAFGTDPTVYNWGNLDGSGDPINLTPMDYYNMFVYNADFATPEMMSWNAPIGSGNMINNLPSIYPTADYVEFYFSGFNPAYSGMDWTGLTLVFEQVGPTWYLVGVVHGQWTT